MISLNKVLNSASMGRPKRFRPMIYWTMAEYFFKGAPYGVMIFVVWELFRPLEHPDAKLNVLNIILACVLLFVSLVILFFISRKSYITAYQDGYDICCDGRLAVANHLRRLPMGFYNSRDPGDIGAYIVNDYANIELLNTHFLPQFFGAVSMPIIAIAVLTGFNWKLGLTAASVIPLSYPMVMLTTYLSKTMGKVLQRTKRNAESRMIEYIQGIKIIKSFNLGGTSFTRLEKAFRDLKRESFRVESVPGFAMIVSSIILNGGIVLITLVGFSLLLNVQVSLPVYIMFLIAGLSIYSPLLSALQFIALTSFLNLGAERVDALCKTPLQSEGDETQIRNTNIEFKNVSFSYNTVPIIKNISLKIPEKSLTAFVGPSGSGKTTLTRLIARFWDVDSGEILLGDKNIKDYKVDSLMSQISIVFQDVYLFHDTIFNNIRMGRENATREEVIAAAKAARCHDFIELMPEGYDTMVGEGGSTLSGGEKQRISIARAILKNAPIILLDEATAALDPENESHIQQAIDDLVKDKTVVIIAHRLGTVVNADNIIVIDKGEVVQQGKHSSLLQKKGLYQKMWEEQKRIRGWKFE